MPFEAGQSGNPDGRRIDKPFRDALRMEIKAAGDDHKALREIARNLLNLARQPESSALPSIKEVADRTDGKVPQAVVGDNEHPPVVPASLSDLDAARAVAFWLTDVMTKKET